MPSYRCYFLDGQDHIKAVADLEADALAEAIDRALVWHCHINELSPPSFLPVPDFGAGQQARLAFPNPAPPATDPRSIPWRLKLTMRPCPTFGYGYRVVGTDRPNAHYILDKHHLRHWA